MTMRGSGVGVFTDGTVVRAEDWHRAGRVVHVEVMNGEVVLVSAQLFHEMLAELGFERVTEV